MDSGITVYTFESFEGRNYQGEGHHIRMRCYIRKFMKARVHTRVMPFEVAPLMYLVNRNPLQMIMLSSQRQDNLKYTSKVNYST